MADQAERRLAGLVLTPDFASHGSLDAFGEWCDNMDAQVIAAIPTFLSRVRVSFLYGGRASHSARYPANREHWHANRAEVWDGMAVFVLLSRDTGDGEFQALVTREKGVSVPDAGQSQTFRSHSERTERYYSLVHTPDDWESLQFEHELLFGDRNLLNKSAERICALPQDVLAVLLNRGSLRLEKPFAEPLLGPITLGLARLAGDPRTQGNREELLELCLAFGSGGESPAHYRNLSRALKSAYSLETQSDWTAIDDIFATATRTKLLAALQLLSDPSEITQPAVDDIARAFSEADIPIDRWTLHRLYLHATFRGEPGIKKNREAS